MGIGRFQQVVSMVVKMDQDVLCRVAEQEGSSRVGTGILPGAREACTSNEHRRSSRVGTGTPSGSRDASLHTSPQKEF